jgi:CheY-like chemotaxis protein
MPSEAVWVNADPVRLEQILGNLLANANRYTPRGGRIWFEIARGGDEVVCSVRDNGQGIPPDLLTRVFDLFVQADGAPEGPRSGLGIGLTLVRHLVDLHGGKVEAHSDGPGTGSKFVVRLAVAPAETVMTSSGGVVPSEPVLARRVAIVEDNADSRVVLAELLELLGHTVLTAANGREALSLVAEDPPEVFLVDIGLPDLDGYTLARALRQTEGGRGARLIAVTGYASSQDVQKARDAGFDAHVTKPFEIDELVRLLQSHPSLT